MQNLHAASFEALHRRAPDPWHFASAAYERDRYQSTIEALTRGAYGPAFEPGCAVGELTAQLARVCERVLATDVAPTAVQRARHRCAAFKNVSVLCSDLAAEQPAGPYDLVVLSEIGYYFGPAQLLRIGRALASTLAPGGELVAVHWLGCSADHALHGDAVHDLLGRHLPLEWAQGGRHDGFRIDNWIRA
jgi:protein-L-isoaspartate O-methyltransferase